jgi:hypothetical protein
MANDHPPAPSRRQRPLAFTRGGRLFRIAAAPASDGYLGYCDGRIVASGADRAQVTAILIAPAIA